MKSLCRLWKRRGGEDEIYWGFTILMQYFFVIGFDYKAQNYFNFY